MTDVGLLHRLRSATATRAVELLGAFCPGAPDEAVAERLVQLSPARLHALLAKAYQLGHAAAETQRRLVALIRESARDMEGTSAEAVAEALLLAAAALRRVRARHEELFDADADAAAAFSRVLLDLAGLADRLCPGVAVEDGVEEF